MSTTLQTRIGVPRLPVALRTTAHRRWRERRTAAVLLGILAVLALIALARPAWVPWAVFLVVIVASGVLHRPRVHLIIVGAVLFVLLAIGLSVGDVKPEAGGTAASALLISAITLWRARARARVGVQGVRGEQILFELREQLEGHGRMPELPAPWHVESCVRSATGQAFSGDFVVIRTTAVSARLEIVLVDVSGSGFCAASRSLGLAGAFDALLGAVSPERFLAEANGFVVRQGWHEGFATAAHLLVDLESGHYELRRAGHPPPIAFRGGCGTWAVLDGDASPALGLVNDPSFPVRQGQIDRGDALFLFSDGVVEDRGTRLDDGIARLMGLGDHLVTGGFEGGAERLCREPADGDDDGAVVILWAS